MVSFQIAFEVLEHIAIRQRQHSSAGCAPMGAPPTFSICVTVTLAARGFSTGWQA